MYSFFRFLLLPFRYFLDVLFPHCCLFCQRPFTPLCQKCSEKLDFCTQLEAPIFYPDLPVKAVCIFDAQSRKIIHTYKYRGISDVSIHIAKLMYTHIQLPSADLISAVPPDPAREKKRGFDHTELLAKHLSSLLKVPYLPTLHKLTATQSQAKTTTRQERQTHLKNQFALLPSVTTQVRKKHILLIDDVCTTGSTLRTCSELLRNAGATVHPIVFCMRI